MPFRKQLLRLCEKIAPHGSVLWIVANGVRFQFFHGNIVWVSIENPQTGVLTEIWSSDTGFRTSNELLQRWFIEGVELMEIEYRKHLVTQVEEQLKMEQDLAEHYLTRFQRDQDLGME